MSQKKATTPEIDSRLAVPTRLLKAFDFVKYNRGGRMSDGEIAEAIGMRQQNISGIRAFVVDQSKPFRSITAENLSEFCRKYNINGHWVLTGDGEMDLLSPDRIDIEKLSKQVEKLTEIVTYLAPDKMK